MSSTKRSDQDSFRKVSNGCTFIQWR